MTEKWNAVWPLSISALNAVRSPVLLGCAMSSLRRKPFCGAPVPPGTKIDVLSMDTRNDWSCAAEPQSGVGGTLLPWNWKYYKKN
jgi:hypothetical protein